MQAWKKIKFYNVMVLMQTSYNKAVKKRHRLHFRGLSDFHPPHSCPIIDRKHTI